MFKNSSTELTKENKVLTKVKTVLTKKNTVRVLMNENTVLTKVYTVLTKKSTVLTEVNTVLTKINRLLTNENSSEKHLSKCKSGAVVELQFVSLKGLGSSHTGAAFYFDSFFGKLTENCRKTPSLENKNP
jgi:hypothetical protein